MDFCMCRNIFILFLFFIWILPSRLFAVDLEPKDERTFKQIIIDEDKQISKHIDAAAKSVDNALAGGPVDKKPNLTHIIVRQRVDWAIVDGPLAYNPYLDVRLSLPNFEKKWQLKFTTYDEDQVDRGINRNRLQTAPVRQTYGGDVGFFQNLGDIHTEFQPRFELREGLQTSYILKFSRPIHYSEITLSPELQFFAKSDQGVGEFFGFNTDFHLYKSLFMSLINEEQYVDQDNVFSTNSGLRFTHAYNDLMSQMYALIFESSSRTTYHLDRWTLEAGFTHKLLKNVIHYSLTPYLAFERNFSFRGSPGIIVEVNVIF